MAVGEGETTWPQIIEDMEAGELGGIYGSNGVDFDFADAPVPR